MKKEYYKIYDVLYDRYPEEFLAYRLGGLRDDFLTTKLLTDLQEFAYEQELYSRMIRDLILMFEVNSKYSLRPDAKLFLISNFNQMIIKPLLYAMHEEIIELNSQILSQNINSDIQTILRFSSEIRKEDEVSGHDIMKAIDELWPQLESTKYEIWG